MTATMPENDSRKEAIDALLEQSARIYHATVNPRGINKRIVKR